MLEPMMVVEVPGDGRVVEGAVGERSVVPVARAAVEGSRPDPELAERPRRRRFTARVQAADLA